MVEIAAADLEFSDRPGEFSIGFDGRVVLLVALPSVRGQDRVQARNRLYQLSTLAREAAHTIALSIEADC
jgi:hypothetical protein